MLDRRNVSSLFHVGIVAKKMAIIPLYVAKSGSTKNLRAETKPETAGSPSRAAVAPLSTTRRLLHYQCGSSRLCVSTAGTLGGWVGGSCRSPG